MYASDKMGEAYEKAAEEGLQWQKDLQEWQRPFWETGKAALPGLEAAANNQITPDARLGGMNLNLDPNWVSAQTELYGLDTTPNVRGRLGNANADPQAFQGFQGLTDFAGQGGNWGILGGTPATQSGGAQGASGATQGGSTTQQSGTSTAGPEGTQAAPTWQDIITQDYLRAAANERKAKGRLGTRGDAPIQGSEDALMKAYARSLGEIEGVKGQRLQQELARRTYDRDTAMGQRQQQVSEQGSAAQMKFDQLTRNRERAFAEMFAEDEATFDRRFAGNQQRMDIRDQYFRERAAEDEAKFSRQMADRERQMAERAQYWQELLGSDEQMWKQLFENARLGQSAASGAATAATNASEILSGQALANAGATGSRYSNIGDIFKTLFDRD